MKGWREALSQRIRAEENANRPGAKPSWREEAAEAGREGQGEERGTEPGCPSKPQPPVYGGGPRT